MGDRVKNGLLVVLVVAVIAMIMTAAVFRDRQIIEAIKSRDASPVCCPADGDCCDPCQCSDCKCEHSHSHSPQLDRLQKRIAALEVSLLDLRKRLQLPDRKPGDASPAGKQPANPGRWIDMQPPANVGASGASAASGDAGPADAKE